MGKKPKVIKLPDVVLQENDLRGVNASIAVIAAAKRWKQASDVYNCAVDARTKYTLTPEQAVTELYLAVDALEKLEAKP